jgi:3D (Asp-Asp-Asp) domain-containing protein
LTLTIGRSARADVIIDEPHAAPLHASVHVTGSGEIFVTDLGSVNGIVVDGARRRGAEPVRLTDGALRIGRTPLRIRTTLETLPPEKAEHTPDIALARNPGRIAAAGVLAFLAYVAYTAWAGAPRDLASTVVTSVTFALGGAAVWVTGWALLSRMLTGEWRWVRHAAVFFGVMSIVILVTGVLDVTWFALALPQWKNRDTLITVVAFAVALYGHLTIASNLQWRRAAIVATLLPVLVAGTTLWVQQRSQARNVNYIGVDEVVYPPALRLRAGSSVDEYFQRAGRLKDAADAKRKAMPPDDEGGEQDSED